MRGIRAISPFRVRGPPAPHIGASPGRNSDVREPDRPTPVRSRKRSLILTPDLGPRTLAPAVTHVSDPYHAATRAARPHLEAWAEPRAPPGRASASWIAAHETGSRVGDSRLALWETSNNNVSPLLWTPDSSNVLASTSSVERQNNRCRCGGIFRSFATSAFVSRTVVQGVTSSFLRPPSTARAAQASAR